MAFDFRPIADALAERGRVVVRRAYADWSFFDEDRRMLTRSHVELIEMPQRLGTSRKNAADIKMAVDAMELAFEREYVSTFAICTGDSDFTPLVHKLRELNKRVIGVGVEKSTSALLPPACDEFLYYDRLEGVEAHTVRARRARPGRSAGPELRSVVLDGAGSGRASALSGLKNQLRRIRPDFSEKKLGYRSFLQFCQAAATSGAVELHWNPEADDYLLTATP